MLLTVLYKKAAAALLLAIMLLTSVVQITHSHAAKTCIAVQLKKATTVSEAFAVLSNDANCFICDYQLAKDADNFFAPAIIISSCNFITINDGYVIHEPAQTVTQFVTRGPPSSFSAI